MTRSGPRSSRQRLATNANACRSETSSRHRDRDRVRRAPSGLLALERSGRRRIVARSAAGSKIESMTGSTAEGSKRYERLEWPTIVRRFPDQWVIVMSLDWSSSIGTEIASAIVVAHGTSREAALDAALPMVRHYGGEFACVYTARQILLSRPDGRPAGRA